MKNQVVRKLENGRYEIVLAHSGGRKADPTSGLGAVSYRAPREPFFHHTYESLLAIAAQANQKPALFVEVSKPEPTPDMTGLKWIRRTSDVLLDRVAAKLTHFRVEEDGFDHLLIAEIAPAGPYADFTRRFLAGPAPGTHLALRATAIQQSGDLLYLDKVITWDFVR